MLRLFLAALSLAACGAPRPAAPSFKVSQSFSCPYPAQTGVMTIEADGKAALNVFEGFGPSPTSRSTRQKKRLAPKDVRELSAVLARSDYKSMPGRAESFPPRHDVSDACSRTLEISSGGVVKSISYSDGDVPDDLARLVKEIDGIADRVPWEEDAYPWEKR